MKKKYVSPVFRQQVISIEYSLAQSSIGAKPGVELDSFETESESWYGTDLDGFDGYQKGDI